MTLYRTLPQNGPTDKITISLKSQGHEENTETKEKNIHDNNLRIA